MFQSGSFDYQNQKFKINLPRSTPRASIYNPIDESVQIDHVPSQHTQQPEGRSFSNSD